MNSGVFLRKVMLPVVLIAFQCMATARADNPAWIYSVKSGDTLTGISEIYLANPNDWPKLRAFNKILNPRRLAPGDKLHLPVTMLRKDAAVAEVIHTQGKSTRTPLHAAEPLTLAVDDRLEVGDKVTTGSNASVSLRFVDGSRLLISPNTQITLSEMMLFGETGMAQTIIELHRGSVDTQVANQVKPAARYEIKSRTLNLAVRGTDFRVHSEDPDQAYVTEVLEGAVDANGEQGKAVSVRAGFGTLAYPGQAPREPQALLPPPDLGGVSARLERLPLRFSLPAIPGVERYRAQVFEDRSFSKLLLDGVFKGNTAKWADLPDGRYVLRVRAIDQSGLEGLNADHEFVLKARPQPPFISAPLDGKKSYGTEAQLRWSTSTSAKSYRVQLSATPDFSVVLNEASGLEKTELDVPLASGQYYWRIASIAEGNDQGPFSDVQGFTQRPIPASPAMQAPEISDTHMVFRWPAGGAGSQYQIQLASDPEFKNVNMDQVLTANQATIDKPGAGTYYLRIKSMDTDGFSGPFGSAQKIEIPESKWWRLLLLIPLLPLAL